MWPAGVLGGAIPARERLASPAPVHIGYVGNIGEANCPDAIARVIDLAPRDRFRFTIAASGAGAKALEARIGTRANVTLRDYLDEAGLATLDVHFVSLRDEWAHVSVPSKAITAVMTGSPFLYAGPEDSDTWGMLGVAGWRLPADGGGDVEIQQCLNAIGDAAQRRSKQENAVRLARELIAMRDDALDRLCGVLSRWGQATAGAGNTDSKTSAPPTPPPQAPR